MSAAAFANEGIDLSLIEASKRRAAYKAVDDHFLPEHRYIGIGSGSTVVYVVEAIAARGRDVTSKMIFVPTSDQSKEIIVEAGLPVGSVDSLPLVEGVPSTISSETTRSVDVGAQDLVLKGKRQKLDIAFDGADEIDEELNCIKGGGACLFQEKLVVTNSRKFVCVAGMPPAQLLKAGLKAYVCARLTFTQTTVNCNRAC